MYIYMCIYIYKNPLILNMTRTVWFPSGTTLQRLAIAMAFPVILAGWRRIFHPRKPQKISCH